jgi:hypothetical protein
MSELVVKQFLMYKATGEIELNHITDEIYDKLKNQVNVPNNEILVPAFNWRVKRHIQMIETFIDNRDAIKFDCKRLLDYVSIDDNKDQEFINSCKEYKLKLFYDKFENLESLKTELTKIFQ